MGDIEVVFLAPDATSRYRAGSVRKTILFADGEPLPRIGECVIIGFDAEPSRWVVQDVAHIFERDAHGIAIKLVGPVAD